MACENLIKLNKAKCKVPYLAQGNPWDQYSLEDEWIEGSPAKDLGGGLVEERLDMAQQCALKALKAKCIQGCIKSSVGSRSREGILPLYSALVRSHVKCCIQIWGCQHRKNTDMSQKVQRRAMKIIR